MALKVGQRLGIYEILGAIGAGGMGEVYRAKDTKLERDVAIKILPEDFARDPERLARFKREAQLLASLNHPNIAAIHGLEEHESQPFLVLELVDGEDLAERLRGGAIPVDETLEIAKQMAGGLEEAHEKGIIHRDLKPANAKLTPEGIVKILDFGLAKALEGEPTQDVNISDSPTRLRQGFGEASPATAAGVILGTAAYMSPEQAKGKSVDRRGDIWAFGSLVFEMLTGTKAFAGNDVSETLAAILRDEPDWNRLPAETPAKLRALLERCLRKNPRERQRDMGDARLELSAPDAEPATARAAPQRGRTAVALVAGILLGALILGWLWNINRPPPPLVTRMVIPLPEGQRLVERRTSPVAVSPDGRTIVYAAQAGETSMLYRRPLDVDEATAIPGTEGGHSPFFSPDGESLGFFTDDALKKVPVSGGAPMTLAPAEALNLGASWGRDGTIVYAPSAGAGSVLMTISQAGGEPEPLTQAGELANPMGPQILADGDTVLFSLASTDKNNSLIASLESGEISKPDAPDGSIAFVPSGHLLYWSAGSIAAVPFDVHRGVTTGDGAIVLGGVASQTTASLHSTPYLSVSDSGSMVYVSGAQRDQRMALVGRGGSARPLTEGGVHAPRLSPDGGRVAYNVNDVWIYDIARATRMRLTVEGSAGIVAWKPNGRAIAFGRPGAVYETPADGSGAPSVMLEREHATAVESWSSDGRYLALTEAHPSTGLDIWIFPIGEEPVPFLDTPADENGAKFSPDGRFVAYQSDESGQDEVYVRPFPGSDAKWKISTDGGTAPVWSRDGTELFYRQGEDLMAVSVETDADFGVGRPELVVSGNYVADPTDHPGYDVMPDGRIFVMIQRNPEAPLTEIHVVLNWFQELNRLVPIP